MPHSRFAAVIAALALGLSLFMAQSFAQSKPDKDLTAKLSNPEKKSGNYYSPTRTSQKLELSAEPSEKLGKLPQFVSKNPKFAAAKLGTGDDALITVIFDEVDNGECRFYCDANNNEDMTDDGVKTWKSNETGSYFSATIPVTVDYRVGNRNVQAPYTAMFSRSKNKDYDQSYCYPQESREGHLTLNGRRVLVALSDDDCDGCFDDIESTTVFVDTDMNGIIESEMDTVEAFKATEPFNVGGVSYRVSSISVTGDELIVAKSDVEVDPRPYFHAGNQVLDFTATDIAGKEFSLSQLRGSVVLFWFWSGNSEFMRENAKKLNELHKRNKDRFKIVGISCDTDKESFLKFVDAEKLDWIHLYDGQGMNGPVVKTYRVRSTPQAFVVDPDGNIILSRVQPDMVLRELPKIIEDEGPDFSALRAPAPEESAAFSPKLRLGEWWMCWLERRSSRNAAGATESALLLFMVTSVADSGCRVLMTSSDGYSFEYWLGAEDLATKRVIPTFIAWDGKNEKLGVSREKTAYTVDGSPALVLFPEYSTVDTMMLAFPTQTGSSASANVICEADTTKSRSVKLTQTSGIDVSGRLWLRLKSEDPKDRVRLIQCFERGTAFPVYSIFQNGPGGTRGIARLVRHGNSYRALFLASASRMMSAAVRDKDSRPPER
jgi:peroxiredoxin